MGAQKSIGIVVREFALGLFDEVKHIFQMSKDIKINKAFLSTLKESLERVSKRVMGKWKEAIQGFSQGAISGFFSNIITVIINGFVTTGKRAVKMIREGFFSLLRAFKILLCPPAGMTKAEAAPESTKLIDSGLVVTGGLAIEE
ncbi:MAG: hypothetical protein RR844_08245, partial [Clostridium sp.]